MAGEFALAAGEDDAFLLAHQGHKPGAVDFRGHFDGGYGVGGAGFVGGQELQAEGLDAGAAVFADGGVAVVHGFGAFGEDAVQAQAEAVEEGYVGGPGGLAAGQGTLGGHQVKVEAGHLGVLVGLPAALADADEGQSGGDHKAFLGAGGHQVAVPAVHGEGEAGEAADGVHQEELVKLALDDAGDGFQVVGDAGGGFVVGDQHGFDGRVFAEFGADGVGVNGVAPFEIHTQDVGAVGLGDLDEAVAERAGGGGDDPVAGGEGVDHGGFQGAGAAGGEDVQVVVGHKDLFEAGGGGLDEFPEFRPPMVDHRQGHFGYDVVGDGGGAGGAEVLRGDFGQGHRVGSWGLGDCGRRLQGSRWQRRGGQVTAARRLNDSGAARERARHAANYSRILGEPARGRAETAPPETKPADTKPAGLDGTG